MRSNGPHWCPGCKDWLRADHTSAPEVWVKRGSTARIFLGDLPPSADPNMAGTRALTRGDHVLSSRTQTSTMTRITTTTPQQPTTITLCLCVCHLVFDGRESHSSPILKQKKLSNPRPISPKPSSNLIRLFKWSNNARYLMSRKNYPLK